MRIKIRETDQKVETTSKRLSDHLTLNMKVEMLERPTMETKMNMRSLRCLATKQVQL